MRIVIEDFNSKYANIRKCLEEETRRFISNRSNVSKLGEGVSGETFRYNNNLLKNLVIKTPKNGYNEDYNKEYSNLMSIPTDKIGGQEAVARVFDFDSGKHYLISTLVSGHSASVFNKYNDAHFKSLFDKMFELDKAGIYHGDLNGKNILLNNQGRVNFIDYQWTEFVPEFNFYDTEKIKKMLLPLHVFPENAQMFEMASMPYYIENLYTNSEKISFMKNYLQAKSEYHSKRSLHIAKLLPRWYSSEKYLIEQSLKEEQAKAKIYKYPDDGVLKLELKKIQFLSDYRDAYSRVDENLPDRNIITSTSAYLCAMSSVQDFRKSVQKQLNNCYDSDKKIYLNSMLEYGNYWYNNLKNYTSDTFDYVMRALENKPNTEEVKHHFYINERNPREIKSNRDILTSLGSFYRAKFDVNFDVPYGIQTTIKNMYEPAVKDLLRLLSYDSKSNHQLDKVKNISKKSFRFNNDGKYLDLLNISELATLKIREFRSYLKHNLNSYSALSILNDLLQETAEFTGNLFQRIYNGLKYEFPENILVKGYSDMRKFNPKL